MTELNFIIDENYEKLFVNLLNRESELRELVMNSLELTTNCETNKSIDEIKLQATKIACNVLTDIGYEITENNGMIIAKKK